MIANRYLSHAFLVLQITIYYTLFYYYKLLFSIRFSIITTCYLLHAFLLLPIAIITLTPIPAGGGYIKILLTGPHLK